MLRKDATRLREQLREKLENFEIYRDYHNLFAVLTNNSIITGYRTGRGTFSNLTDGTTYFDIQLKGNTCFINSFQISTQLRGLGFGHDMYKCIEAFVRKDADKKRIQVTATAERVRKFYLVIGFKPINEIALAKQTA